MYLLLSGREIVAASVPAREQALVNHTIVSGVPSLQTPEGFPFLLLLKAHEWRIKERRSFASGVALVSSWLGEPPTLVQQDIFNGRIETCEDMAAAEGVLKFGQKEIAEDPPDLHGLHVLVLGGSGGIGNACMDALEKLGATYNAPTRQQLDLSREQGFSELTTCNAVIHTAGEYNASPEDIMRVNFFSCFNILSQAESRRWEGNIVLISSTASAWGRQGIPIYSASKAALNALVESDAARLASKGILVNIVAPGKVNTRLQKTINPSARTETMLSPEYVARIVCRYLHTNQFGKLIFLRKGFDCD